MADFTKTGWAMAFARVGTTKFQLDMHILQPIGSVISTLVVIISAQNWYEITAKDLWGLVDIQMMC